MLQNAEFWKMRTIKDTLSSQSHQHFFNHTESSPFCMAMYDLFLQFGVLYYIYFFVKKHLQMHRIKYKEHTDSRTNLQN